jgi:anti-sigma factor RsiW
VALKRACPSGAELLALAEGLSDPQDRERIEGHLPGCAACRARLAEITRLSGALRAEGRAGSPARPTVCPGDELLAAYADGSLDGRRATRIERHVAGCRRCLAEVADLLALAHADARDAPEGAVQGVLDRLEEERRTAVVRLGARSVELVRGFVRAYAPADRGALSAPLEPAFATARGGRVPVRLAWSGSGIEVECEVRRSEAGATLTGRVTAGGDAARATSITLATPDRTWGPESPDARGRFGPWPMPAGTNRLLLAAGGDLVELAIEVEASGAPVPGGDDGPGPDPDSTD